MDNPIIITPQEIINMVLAICGAIITISGAGAVIIRAIAKAKEPNKKQDERLDKIEQDIKNLKEQHRDGTHDFYVQLRQIEEINDSQRDTNRVIIESLRALTAHALDGNNTESLKNSAKQLDEYLINKL